MAFEFLKKLFSGAPASAEAQPADPVEHHGYTIVATPRPVQGGWSTEGVISKTVDGEEHSQRFIRADTVMSREEAIRFSTAKARKIIDEQGERMFDEIGPD